MLAARPRRPPQRRHWPFTGWRPPSSSTLPWPSRWQVGACWELRSLLRNNHFLGISTAGLRRQQTFSMSMLVESGAKVGSSFYQFVFIWFLLLFLLIMVLGRLVSRWPTLYHAIHYAAGGAAVANRFTASQNAAGAHVNGPAWCSCKEGRRTEVALHRVCRGNERKTVLQL